MGRDGVTLFQRGFPLKIAWGGANTPLQSANFGIGTLRPNVIAGCNKAHPAAQHQDWVDLPAALGGSMRRALPLHPLGVSEASRE